MKTLIRAACAALALTAVTPPVHADEAGREPQALMEDYFRLWNLHDAKTIVAKYYRLDGSNPISTEAGLSASFAQLKSQGYDHSALASMETCLLSPSLAMTIMRYTRLKTDGTFMPPQKRVSMYRLRKFPDGWRVIDMQAMSDSVQITCKSAKD